HHFPYYNIQCLDKIQMSRMPADLAAFEGTLAFRGTPDSVYLLARLWELTNTRYVLGPAGYLETLNGQLDPAQRRFRIVQAFNVVPKPGIAQPTRLEEFTAVTADNGGYALFEFTGALPRVKLYANWQVSTNDPVKLQAWLAGLQPYLPPETYGILNSLPATDQATLQTLADTNFVPGGTVLVSRPLPDSSTTNENPGTVEFTSYAPKHIVLRAQTAAPCVLLLNDRYDPQWSVRVDGQPAELLRCNYIMRGVYLTPGQHTVEFNFTLPNQPLYITLTAIGVGILLSGFLFVTGRRKSAG
ncbi:MAG: hypothetical protein ABUL66_02315, partial [Verrucomicrobiota bacterium]